MTILGLHHITVGAQNAQRTVDFYTGVLGLRMVKKTVNFDDPGSYHLYFGDETGAPGTAITFFEWPTAPRGKPGIGGTHHFAMTVPDRNALLKWKRHLVDLGIKVRGPYDRTYFESIYFEDPDGLIIELATAGPGFAVDEAVPGENEITPDAELTLTGRDETALESVMWPEPVPTITADMALTRGMHHISAISSNIARTHTFYHDLLGFQLVKKTVNFDDPKSKHWYWSAGDGSGQPGTLITYFERDIRNTRRAMMGAGQTHHFAFAVSDEDDQLRWREKLVKAGLRVSPVMDRTYFKSIYTQDPDGHIVEIATVPPGFLVDEPFETLGTQLMLPPHVSAYRSDIERVLTPIVTPEWVKVK